MKTKLIKILKEELAMNIKFKNIVSLGMSILLSVSSGNLYSQNYMIYADSNYIDGINTMNATTFTIEGGTADTDYTYENGVLTIISPKSMTIQNTDPNTPTTDRIEINSEANLTLNGVNINTSTGPAIKIQDDAIFNVNITLAENSENFLKTTATNNAGLQKNSDASSGTLTIDGSGVLTATGGSWAAGIGGGDNGSGNNITISGGEVTATGGYGAGIGGGYYGSGNNITISGGEVTAIAEEDGAGIGGGCWTDGNYITISGGIVTATGTGGAGIGGGTSGNGNNITISGGVVTAIGKIAPNEHGAGAGIGGGCSYAGTVSAKDNLLEGNTVLIVASEDFDKNALQGFEFKSGIVFESQGNSGTYEGTMYGDEVMITADATFPADFIIEEDKTLIVNSNTTLIIDDNTTLTINDGAILKNRGTLIENGTINFEGNGAIETEIIYNENNKSKESTVEYKTYQDSSGIKTYGDLPTPTREGYDFEGWYTEGTGGEQIKEDTEVMPNLHVLYAHWEGNGNQEPEPTPNPTPEPTPGEKPEPTPEPTPGEKPEPTPNPTPGEKPNGWNSEGFSWNYIDNEINSSEIQKPESKPNETIKTKTLKDIQNEIPERLKNIAYIKSYEDGTFKPNNNITRAEAAAMLYRLIYDGTQIDINILYQYNDVEKNNWSTAAIAYLTQHGIIQGFDGKFRPDDKITRAEFVKIVYESLLRYNANKNSKLIYGENEFKFSDVKNDWTFEPIKQLATNEMINGYGNDLFKPNENITRAEAVKIINKAFGRSENWIGSISFNDVSENHWAYKFIMNAANGEK